MIYDGPLSAGVCRDECGPECTLSRQCDQRQLPVSLSSEQLCMLMFMTLVTFRVDQATPGSAFVPIVWPTDSNVAWNRLHILCTQKCLALEHLGAD